MFQYLKDFVEFRRRRQLKLHMLDDITDIPVVLLHNGHIIIDRYHKSVKISRHVRRCTLRELIETK